MSTSGTLSQFESWIERPVSNLRSAQIHNGTAEVLSPAWESWQELCLKAQSEPFARPEWIATYLRSFESGARVSLATASEDNTLLAVLPLVRKRGYFEGMPVMKLLCPANEHSVRFSFPCVRGEQGQRAIQEIWNAIKLEPGWDVLEVPIFLEDGPCQKIFDCAERDGYNVWTRLYSESPILHMQKGPDGKLNWLGGTNRHFRHELRRFQRLLETELAAKPNLTRREDLDIATADEFFALEAAGWKGEQGTAVNNGRETRSFYEEIARVGSEAGYFRFYSYQVNGALLAGTYGVATNDCFYPMKITYREDLHRCAPGHLMFNAIFEDCAANGVNTVYFGGARDRYKTMWTPEVQRNRTGFIFNSKMYPRLVHGMKTRVLPAIKRCQSFIHSEVLSLLKRTKTAEQEADGTEDGNAGGDRNH